jgi:hypothetical protein
MWDVVSLAAVAAIDHGRRRMFAMSLAPPLPLYLLCDCGWLLVGDVRGWLAGGVMEKHE